MGEHGRQWKFFNKTATRIGFPADSAVAAACSRPDSFAAPGRRSLRGDWGAAVALHVHYLFAGAAPDGL
jgi:hypothetical protein